ncbi:AAA family ATPase [Niallia sp. FSL W8-1348]|uniref:AAA family ATPase n=1 Tax=Niallia sp. FSL W8-1348 TaxID=2954656 RepID=UPI0030F809F5
MPIELDFCIFCGQILDGKHVEIIENNFNHVNSTIIQEKEKIQRDILKNDLKELKLTFGDDDKEIIEKEALANKIHSIVSLINNNISIFSQAINKAEIIDYSIQFDFSSLTEEITEEIVTLNERLNNLNQSNISTNKIVEQLESKRKQLVRNSFINNNIELFKEWFEINDKINQLTNMKKGFSTNTITKKAKEAFKDLVEENYVTIFKKYCKELKVRDVEVKLKPQKGKTFRSKYVAEEKFKITDIMSEGEQKAIAMAEFATDLKMRKNYNTVIFDDPVTSLDYKRTENFAKLIYNLSKDRQVIVYTHNILFYYFLYNQCESDKNTENKFYKVDSYDQNNKGLVSESFSGRLDSIGDLKKKINGYKQKIENKNCIGDELEYNISLAYTEIRTWCELIVEEGFFKSIIRRYEPNIRFTKLSDIDGSFIYELETVTDLFNRSCRWMIGHSQPIETLHSKPNREDFFEDFDYIKSITNKFTSVKW